MNKLLIIDGHNYLYRAYYGVPSAAKLPNGQQINAFYGFLSYLRKNVSYIQPDNVLVVFDTETGIQSKLNKNKDYKQNRDYTDMSMFEQLPIIKKALEYIGITYVEDDNHEGDDVIVSVANKESVNNESFISTQDKDFFQIIEDNIYVLRDEKVKTESRYSYNQVVYTKEKFIEQWEFQPANYLDYLSLKGDPSDNIKGVQGIGKLRASRLVKSYGDIENIIESSEEVRLIGNEEMIRKNKQFLKMERDLDVDYKLRKLEKEKVFQSANNILDIIYHE
ncbi:MAG: 5'-3' exonuclease H3TH domain-containing protein [Candidatus Dojkabacteria bacterium]|nr:5'-3' exonuclease H3TH domain-containing protein [Candidatus Dojkabacteria bacterium]